MKTGFSKLFKNKLRHLPLKPNSRGDLLIEVMIAIAIIGVILTAGYVLSNRGLNSSTNAEKRSQAQAIAQGQVERIQNWVQTQPAEISKVVHMTNFFCIASNGEVDVEDTYNPSGLCPDYDNDIGVGVGYSESTGSFTVVAGWNPATGDPVTDREHLTYKDRTTVYYKPPVPINFSNFSLNAYIRGYGTVSSSPGGINCDASIDADCSEAYSAATTVTLTATPATGYVFSNWSGDCISQVGTTCILTVDTIKYAAANFIPAVLSDGITPDPSPGVTPKPKPKPTCPPGAKHLAVDKHGNYYCYDKPGGSTGTCPGSVGCGGSSSGSSGGSGTSTTTTSTGGGCPFPPDTGGCVGCFVAGTMVDTAEGPKPIEQIKTGDTVETWDVSGSKMSPSKVAYTVKHTSIQTLWVVTSGGSVVTTGVHLFWTDRGWIPAASLVPGASQLLDDHGHWQKVQFMMYGANQDVYNIHVENTNHDFFANGFLVHNNKIL